MEQRLKQRLVGAAVLVLLAIIFLPMLFEDALEQDRIFDAQPPTFPKQEFEARLRQMQETTAEAGKQALARFKSLPNVPVPSAWAVQAGSFAQAENATLMRDQLRQAGFPAFVEEASGSSKKSLYRVLVGPALEKDKALQWQAELQKTPGLSSFVVSHSLGN